MICEKVWMIVGYHCFDETKIDEEKLISHYDGKIVVADSKQDALNKIEKEIQDLHGIKITKGDFHAFDLTDTYNKTHDKLELTEVILDTHKNLLMDLAQRLPEEKRERVEDFLWETDERLGISARNYENTSSMREVKKILEGE